MRAAPMERCSRQTWTGQVYAVLKSFFGTVYNSSIGAYTNSDGDDLFAGLTQSGGVLYGTTWEGGNAGSGTVFKMNTDGTGYTVLRHFFTG